MARHARSSLLADLDAIRVAAQRTQPVLEKGSSDPARWMHSRLGAHLWTRQQKIARAVRDHRYVAVPSCHGPGKSFLGARLACWWLCSHPPGTAFAVTTAPSGPQVKGILWREIGRAHRVGGLPGRITLDARWYWPLGGSEELVAFGRKPKVDRAGDQDLASAFQGIHAEYVLVLIDEAAGVPRAIFDAADTLATTEGSRVVAMGNPDDPLCAFADACQPGSGWQTIHISAFDTPNFTGEPVPPGVAELLVSQKWVEERKARWGESSPMYQSKVLGLFPSASEDTVITPPLIRAAQERSMPDSVMAGVFALDCARMGADEAVCHRVVNGRSRQVFSVRSADTMALTGQMAQHSNRFSRRVPIVIDISGVGGGVYDRLNEQGHPVLPFDGGGRARDNRRFANRRAEVWWSMRTSMEQRLVDIDADDDMLAAQLGTVRFHYDSSGRIVLEAKHDLKRRGLPSPDRADTVAMGLAHQDTAPTGFRLRSGPGDITSDLLTKPM